MLVAQLPELIQQLEQQYPVKQICINLRLCENKVQQVQDTRCTFCQFGVDQVEQYLAQNSTQQQIINTLSYVCTMVPAEFSGACVALVQQVPTVITYIEEKYPASTVCSLIGFCESQEKPQGKLAYAIANMKAKLLQ